MTHIYFDTNIYKRAKKNVFILNIQQLRESPWTAFMYRHPDAQYVELGLGGKSGNLVVWLFGTEWTTSKVQLQPSKWHSVCLCWSPAKERPALYVDGNPMNLMTGWFDFSHVLIFSFLLIRRTRKRNQTIITVTDFPTFCVSLTFGQIREFSLGGLNICCSVRTQQFKCN